MSIFLGILFCGLVAVAAVGVLGYFSEDSREARVQRKSRKLALVTKTKQLNVARSALTKIAANDSGNAVLDAQIALEEINRHELNELES